VGSVGDGVFSGAFLDEVRFRKPISFCSVKFRHSRLLAIRLLVARALPCFKFPFVSFSFVFAALLHDGSFAKLDSPSPEHKASVDQGLARLEPAPFRLPFGWRSGPGLESIAA
jgi:hypothetical protein